MWKSKKADQPLLETVIFFILNLFFFAALLFFIVRVSSGDAIMEENYAKTIALTIDSMKPGSEVWIDLQLLYDAADKNKFDKNEVIKFDFTKHLVTVKVRPGAGYSFHYFSNLADPGGITKTRGNSILIIKT
jgi:hypothetical protein